MRMTARKIDTAAAALADVLKNPRARKKLEAEDPKLAEVVCELNDAAREVFERMHEQATSPPESEPQPAAPDRTPRARVVCLADITPERVDWLWEGFIPFGQLTILDGEPGLGKSTLTLDLIARLTRGDVMPNGGPWTTPTSAIVLMLEDHLAQTIRPRLDAAKADVTRVFALEGIGIPDEPDSERQPTLPVDIGHLRDEIIARQARIVVIDPIMAYLGSDIDSHRDQDVRRVTTPLARLAAETGAAIIIVRHLRKSGGSAISRGGGSIGLIGAARLGLLLGRDPEDADARVLAVSKSNIGKVPPALRWRLVDADNGVAYAQWEGIAEGITADQLADVNAGQADEAPEDKQTQMDAAEAALRRTLADGPVSARVAESEVVAEVGCSKRTVRRACESLGVVKAASKATGGKVTGWTWALPVDQGGQHFADGWTPGEGE